MRHVMLARGRSGLEALLKGDADVAGAELVRMTAGLDTEKSVSVVV